MTNRLELNWNLDGIVDEQRYYCSETAIDVNNLPVPKAVLANEARSYVDAAIDVGKTYYVAVGSVKNGVEKLSEVRLVRAVGGDEHWDKVVSLLHFDGDLTDETGRVWTGYGSFSYVSGQFGFGFTSGGGWVSTPASLDLNMSTGDFTIECFINLTSTSGLRALLSSGVYNWGAGNTYMLLDGMNRLEIGSFEDGHIWISSATLPSSGTFHFCLERLAGELRLFVDGALVDSKLSGAALNLSTNGTRIGVNTNNANPFSGVIDELRITKGVARYTANFTPPTEPFPDN